MASSKNPNNYSFALWELVRTFHNNQGAEALILPFPSHNEAEGFRFNYYGFKNALKAEKNELAATASAILVKLLRHKDSLRCDLEFSLRDNQAADIRLEEILRARQEGQQTQSVATESFALETPHEPTHDEVLDNFLQKK